MKLLHQRQYNIKRDRELDVWSASRSSLNLPLRGKQFYKTAELKTGALYYPSGICTLLLCEETISTEHVEQDTIPRHNYWDTCCFFPLEKRKYLVIPPLPFPILWSIKNNASNCCNIVKGEVEEASLFHCSRNELPPVIFVKWGVPSPFVWDCSLALSFYRRRNIQTIYVRQSST